jgi:hypothetical protein
MIEVSDRGNFGTKTDIDNWNYTVTYNVVERGGYIPRRVTDSKNARTNEMYIIVGLGDVEVFSCDEAEVRACDDQGSERDPRHQVEPEVATLAFCLRASQPGPQRLQHAVPDTNLHCIKNFVLVNVTLNFKRYKTNTIVMREKRVKKRAPSAHDPI